MVDASSDLKAAMRLAGETSYPNEACGLVVSVGKKSRIFECKNHAEDKRNQFRIAAEDFARLSDMGEVVGVWHTHCEESENPSDADRAACESSELTWYILAVRKVEDQTFTFSDILVLTPSGFEMDYLGRPYIFGVFDCYSLIVDYYRREFDIVLGNYPHIDNWANLGHNFFAESYEKEGFIRLIDQAPTAGDLFLIQSGATVPNHVAIYLGDEIIMHQTHGRLSRRDIYGGYWQKHTTHHLRRREFCDAL